MSPLVFLSMSTLPLITPILLPQDSRSVAPASTLLKAINLCFSSTVISITTVLNFSLAASLAVLLGVPLSFSSPARTQVVRIAKYLAYVFLALGWMFVGHQEVVQAISDWEILAVWFAPFVCVVYVPLVLQAAIVCLLPA